VVHPAPNQRRSLLRRQLQPALLFGLGEAFPHRRRALTRFQFIVDTLDEADPTAGRE
jgi:hypothetical protein